MHLQNIINIMHSLAMKCHQDPYGGKIATGRTDILLFECVEECIPFQNFVLFKLLKYFINQKAFRKFSIPQNFYGIRGCHFTAHF